MKYFFRVAFLIYIVLILWVSLNPSAGISKVDFNESTYRVDYFLHALAFLTLPILAFFASSTCKTTKLWWVLIGVSTIIAIGTEYLQLVVPDRTFNPLDILSNVGGLIVGILVVVAYKFFQRLKQE
ncbi:MAG: VanZ family protein [Bacteroidales bacterium]